MLGGGRAVAVRATARPAGNALRASPRATAGRHVLDRIERDVGNGGSTVRAMSCATRDRAVGDASGSAAVR
jgi:hypothetical protein